MQQGSEMSNEIERDVRVEAAVAALYKSQTGADWSQDAPKADASGFEKALADGWRSQARAVLAAADAAQGGEAVAWGDPNRLGEVDGFIPNAFRVNAAGRLDRFSVALYTHPAPAAPAVPDGYKLLKDTTPAEREWTEDAGHENGRYYNNCVLCLRTFIGHKRRVLCKACFDAPKPEAVAVAGKEGGA